jgi:hypothetical protein
MDIKRYLRKKALDQVGIETVKGVSQVRYTMFDEDGQQTLPAYEDISLEALETSKGEIQAAIARHLEEEADHAAARARLEEELTKLDTVIADLQAAIGA